MTTGSSADHIFCLNFNSSNSTNKLSGSSYKYYWLWRLFFFFPGENGGKKATKVSGKALPIARDIHCVPQHMQKHEYPVISKT